VGAQFDGVPKFALARYVTFDRGLTINEIARCQNDHLERGELLSWHSHIVTVDILAL